MQSCVLALACVHTDNLNCTLVCTSNTHKRTHANTHTQTLAHTRKQMCTHTHTNTQTHTDTHTHTYTRVCRGGLLVRHKHPNKGQGGGRGSRQFEPPPYRRPIHVWGCGVWEDDAHGLICGGIPSRLAGGLVLIRAFACSFMQKCGKR